MTLAVGASAAVAQQGPSAATTSTAASAAATKTGHRKSPARRLSPSAKTSRPKKERAETVHAAKPAAPEPVAANTTPLPSEETVEAFLKRTFGQDPSITWRVLDISPSEVPNIAHVTISIGADNRVSNLYITPDGNYAITGEIIPFGADPFANNRRKLEAANGPTRGAESPAIEIVEFSDLQCPHCKAAQPVIDKLMEDFPQVQLRFQNFPLQMHPWARKAALTGQCIGEQSQPAFWKYIQGVYDAQSFITEDNADQKLADLAQQSGADPAKLAACEKSLTASKAVDDSVDLGKSLGVTGTPSVFINGRKFGGIKEIPYDALKGLVNFEIEQSKQTAKKP